MVNENTDDDNDTMVDTPDPVKLPGSGQKLRKAREALNLTLKDVSDRLNIRTGLVDALEREDYSKLPAAPYICGYLRSYAKLLELSSDMVIEEYPNLEKIMKPVLEGQTAGLPKTKHAPSESASDKKTYMIAAAGIFLVVILISFFGSDDETIPNTPGSPGLDNLASIEPKKPESTTIKPEEKVVVTTAQTVDKLGEKKIKEETVVNIPPDSVSEKESEDASQEKTQSDEQRVVTAIPESDIEPDIQTAIIKKDPVKVVKEKPVISESKKVKKVKATNKKLSPMLELDFVGSSWVEIYDANGQRLLYEMGEAPNKRKITGAAPFELILGFAPAVKVKYNGQPFDVTTGQESVVVSLSVGKEDDNQN